MRDMLNETRVRHSSEDSTSRAAGRPRRLAAKQWSEDMAAVRKVAEKKEQLGRLSALVNPGGEGQEPGGTPPLYREGEARTVTPTFHGVSRPRRQ